MSALGQNRTHALQQKRRYSITSSASKLQRFGDHETESLGRLRIDHKLPAATCIGGVALEG
jgi:hypothetical protein